MVSTGTPKPSERALNRVRTVANHVISSEQEDGTEGLLTRQLTRAVELSKFHCAETIRNFPPARHDALDLEGLLTPEELVVRDRVREFATKHVAPVIADYWERAEFPHALLPHFYELGIGGGVLPKKYGCQELSMMSLAMANVELARVDGSMSTFFLVHTTLAALTLGMLGSEAQKHELLPGLATFRKVGAWALTEPSNGSDASALQSTARRVSGGWILNGTKRWIGNATFADVVIIWARNLDTKEINAFIVRKGTPGFVTTKIEGKIALRCVQNADIDLTEVFVPDSDRLPGVNSFKDTARVLAASRVLVAWQPIGLAAGAYDQVLRYTQQREQFGAPLAANQLVQERLARMLSTLQAAWLLAWRLTRLHEAGKMSHEQAALVKSFTTSKAREIVALGRELLGGNGIVGEFGLAKAFCDAEAYYTYEGTYDVNALVAARGATGIAAFKPRGKTARK